MIRKLTGTAIGLMVSAALVSAPLAANETEDKIASAITSAVPQLQVTSIEPSQMPGLYRVKTSDGQSVYASEDGRYLMTGDLLEITGTGIENVSERRRANERRETMASYDSADLIRYPADGEEKAVIDVFTDIDCPYCRKMHEEVPELNAYGITVNYYAFPRSGPNTPSWNKYESVWCADNQREAMDRAKAGDTIPNNDCGAPVREQYDIGNQVGVTGTPAIVLEDGSMVPGYVPAKKLAETLGLL